MTTQNVAIFIDYDNVYVSIERYYETHSSRDLKTRILAEIKGLYHGKPLYVLKAYADVTMVVANMATLQRHQVKLEHVYSQNPDSQNRKNASDIALTIDVMRTLLTRPEIDTYVLVTSDSDMLPLVEELRRNGKRVELIYADYCSIRNIGEYVDQAYTVEGLIGKPKYIPMDEARVKVELQSILEVINTKLWSINREYKGRGTSSKKDVRDSLADGSEIVLNDIPFVIDYLFREEILQEHAIPGSKYLKVLINPDWYATCGFTLSTNILKEEDFPKTAPPAKTVPAPTPATVGK